MATKPTTNVATTDEPDEELQDVSLEAYLKADDSRVTDKVRTRHGMLLIAALTDEEAAKIRSNAERPDKLRRGAVKLDDQLYKLLLVTASLYKASPSVPEPEILKALSTKLAGEVTTIATAVIKLSGFEDAVPEVERLGGFSG